VLHLLIATFGVAVSSAILFYILKPVLSPFVAPAILRQDAPLTLPFFPFQSLVGLATGYLMAVKRGEFGKSRAARLVWIVPAVWFLLLFSAWGSQSVLAESRLEHFFWGSIGSSKKDQFLTTLPLLTSVAYAVGNYLGCKRSGTGSRPGFWTLTSL
jgi:hypothetical protein